MDRKVVQYQTASWVRTDLPELLLKFTVDFHATPLSVLLLNRMSALPGVMSFHTTATLEPEAAMYAL
jgi:hypothetical protein